jgi:hypothetical protein
MSDWFKKSKEILALVFMFRKRNCLSIFYLTIALTLTRIFVSGIVRYELYNGSAKKLLSHPIFIRFAYHDALSFRTLSKR